MMKKLFMVIVLVIGLFLVGCAAKNGIVDVDKDGDTVTLDIETEEGEQSTTVKGTTGSDSWCSEGGNWEMTSTGVQGDSSASWKIDKLISSGEYEGLCHVIQTVTTPDGEMNADYYFSEDGESGYYEMEINGQKISQEWHS